MFLCSLPDSLWFEHGRRPHTARQGTPRGPFKRNSSVLEPKLGWVKPAPKTGSFHPKMEEAGRAQPRDVAPPWLQLSLFGDVPIHVLCLFQQFSAPVSFGECPQSVPDPLEHLYDDGGWVRAWYSSNLKYSGILGLWIYDSRNHGHFSAAVGLDDVKGLFQP